MSKFSLGGLSFIFAFLLLSSFACVIGPHHGEVVYPDYQAPQGDYEDILKRWTDREKNYNAFSSTFQIAATFLSQDVLEHQVFMDAQKFHWTSTQLREEKQKTLSEAQSTTTCFVSFYTDRDENNNLDKNKTTWNIFLDANGNRVVPSSIKKVYDSFSVVVQKYPYVNRWTRWYIVKFPIGTNIAASGPLTLTIAGPAGDAHLQFPPNHPVDLD